MPTHPPSAPPDGRGHPVEIITGNAACGVLILCDHASNAIPPEYGDLGLTKAQLERHIAYDIGAADVTRSLARVLGAPAILTRFSRLLIDPNRGEDDPTLVMKLSDGAVVAGNARAGAAEVERRLARFHRPYDRAVTGAIDAALASGRPPAIVSIHSFTPVWKGRARPWHVGILRDRNPILALPLLKALEAETDLVVGDNEPYRGGLPGDTLDRHATRRGLADALIELRQDLISDRAAAEAWGVRLARILAPLVRVEGSGSTAGGDRSSSSTGSAPLEARPS
jgi:predicted N-formylglutamate amidohydrolase